MTLKQTQLASVFHRQRTVNVVELFVLLRTQVKDRLMLVSKAMEIRTSILQLVTCTQYDQNTWTKTGNLRSEDGKQGSAIHTGLGSPSVDDVYEKKP